MREVGDRVELAEIVRARGRLDDEGEPGPVQDLRAVHGVPPGAPHHPEAVVTIGVERVEREREPARSGVREPPRQVLRDADAVGADDDPEAALGRAPDDLEDVAPQQRLAAGQDRQALGREGGDFVDDAEALLGAELAAVREVLRADQRRASGVEIAVLAREIAAVGEVPGDDVGAGEVSNIARCLTCRRSPGPRRASARPPRGPLSLARTSRCRSAPWGGRTRECSPAGPRPRESI